MKFEIANFVISKFDKMNWIVREKARVNAEHRFASKTSKTTPKTRYKLILVGYYGTLLDAKQDLGERLAKGSKDYKEFSKWINNLKKIE